MKFLGAKIGDDVKIYGEVSVLGDPKNLELGAGSSLNEGVLIELRDKIVIGRNVHISPGVKLLTGYLDIETFKSNQEWHHQSRPIYIFDNVWIASGATICAGVTVGEGSVVAAQAVVLKNVPEKSLVAGIPAKLAKKLD